MPDESDFSCEEIKEIALTHVINESNEYNTSESILRQLTVYYSFYATQQDPDHPVWKLLFCEPVSSSIVVNITMDRDGNLIKCSISNQITDEETLRALTPESGRIYELTLEEQAQYARCFLIPMFGMPNKDDLPESAVKEKADQFLVENESIAQDELDRLIQYTSFVINGRETASYPIWEVVYLDAELDRPLYHVSISATTGELISIEIMDWDSPGLG